MSFKGEVRTGRAPDWVANGCRFATENEARQYVTDLMYCWTQVTDTRVVACNDEVNYEWRDGRSHPVITGGPI